MRKHVHQKTSTQCTDNRSTNGFCILWSFKLAKSEVQNRLVFAMTVAYVTVFWKTDLMVTNIETHFLPVDESHTYALSKDTMHLRLDGQVCFYRQLFCDAVIPQGCISWPVQPQRGINKTNFDGKLGLPCELCNTY